MIDLEGILIKIKSTFDAKGVQQAKASMKSIKKINKDLGDLDDRRGGTAFRALFDPKVMSRAARTVSKYDNSSQLLFKSYKRGGIVIRQAQGDLNEYIDKLVAGDTEKKMSKSFQAIQKSGNLLTKDGAIKKVHRNFTDLNSVLGTTKTKAEQASQHVKRMSTPFKGWALSIMFFGMAIVRVFSQIQKLGVTTFNDIMHSVEGQITAFDMLSGSMKYLGFTIGAALEPLANLLIPVIDWIRAWVEENESLARAIFVVGFALGGLLMLAGILVLGFTGLGQAYALLFGKSIGASIIAQGGLFVALATKLNLVAAGASVAASAMALLTAVSIIAGIILAIMWIAKLGKKLGGFWEFIKSWARGLMNAFFLIGATFGGMASEVVNGWKGMWNDLVKFTEMHVQSLLTPLNIIRQAMGKEKLVVNFSGAKADVLRFGDAFTRTFTDVMLMNDKLQKNSFLTPGNGFADSFGMDGIFPSFDYAEQSKKDIDALNMSIAEHKRLLDTSSPYDDLQSTGQTTTTNTTNFNDINIIMENANNDMQDALDAQERELGGFGINVTGN